MDKLYEIETALAFDPTLKFRAGTRPALLRKYVWAQTYSLKKLYDHMYAGKTILFSNYPLTLNRQTRENNTDTLVRMLKKGLPQKEKIRIRAGFSRSLQSITINDTIERWLRQRSKFGVTDLHFRGTRFYNEIDAEAISHFNLLPHCPGEVSFLEMLTLVISSRGIFSDSHSDDGDGSNHCFVGKKLWFAWDRQEGRQKGLQDCTYDAVYNQADFNMEVFASLKSAHWFIVSDNHTLFMPGNFSHKVITLEPYIGFGSFYVSLPNYFHTFKRWSLFDTSDVKENFLDTLHTSCLHKINEIARLPAPAREKWGLGYLPLAAKNWQAGLTKSQQAQLSRSGQFKEMLTLAAAIQK